MKNKRLFVKRLLALGVVGIGIYMFTSFVWGTPPAISGLGFILAGLALFVPGHPTAKSPFEDRG